MSNKQKTSRCYPRRFYGSVARVSVPHADVCPQFYKHPHPHILPHAQEGRRPIQTSALRPIYQKLPFETTMAHKVRLEAVGSTRMPAIIRAVFYQLPSAYPPPCYSTDFLAGLLVPRELLATVYVPALVI